MKTEIGISNKELANQIREIAKMLNDLLEQAKNKGLAVDISINPHYKNMKSIMIDKIIQPL